MASNEGELHQCQSCGTISGMYHGYPEFSRVHACPACGLTPEEQNYKMQEDLANMFTQSLAFSTTSKLQQPQIPRAASPISYSISQHYTHSAHVVVNDIPSGVTVNPTPQVTGDDLKKTLIDHGIDPGRLLPTQLTLFDQASSDQKTRLLQLWSISPPQYADLGAQDLADELGAWEQTTVEQEEEMAKLRYQRSVTQDEARRLNEQFRHGILVSEPEPQTCLGDDHAVEPYIRSGYELLAQRDYDDQLCPGHISVKAVSASDTTSMDHHYNHATDPVFQSQGWWQVQPEQPMEHQYGMFDQMNQFRAPMTAACGGHGQEDEEML